jgi:hypothetical protein
MRAASTDEADGLESAEYPATDLLSAARAAAIELAIASNDRA